MSTHSHICRKNRDGTYTGVYCHLDGYPKHHAPILSKFYATDERVDALLALGNLDQLGPEIGRKHKWDESCSPRCKNWCCADSRDCGTPWEEAAPKTFTDFSYLHETAAEYVYLWSGGKWSYSKVWNLVRFEFEPLPEFDAQLKEPVEVTVSPDTLPVHHACVQAKLVSSNAEALRLLTAGAVYVNDVRVLNVTATLEAGKSYTLRVGLHKAVRVRVEKHAP